MSRPPEQTDSGFARDKSDMKRILDRAVENQSRPKKLNAELVEHLKRAYVIMIEETG